MAIPMLARSAVRSRLYVGTDFWQGGAHRRLRCASLFLFEEGLLWRRIPTGDCRAPHTAFACRKGRGNSGAPALIVEIASAGIADAGR